MTNPTSQIKIKVRESKKHPTRHFRITLTTRSSAGRKDRRTYLVDEVELSEAMQEAGYRITPGTPVPRTSP